MKNNNMDNENKINKIGIIGANNVGRTCVKAMNTSIDGFMSYQDAAKDTFEYIINAPPIFYYEGKKFICKGKHQYREVKETIENVTKISWVCQCGRVV